MIRKMFLRTAIFATILAAGMLAGCGTSTTGPDGGSFAQTRTGVNPSGYPGGQPKDAESPALSSSSEQAKSQAGPKVPVDEPAKK
jgi:hypothetical protein